MDLYSQNIIDHYKFPRNKGEIEKPTLHYTQNNPICGDKISIDLLIENNVLKDLKFQGEGCAISIAGISILSEEVINMKIADILKLNENDIKMMLGLDISERRKKCAMLGLETLQKALKIYKNTS